jgi:urease accessory protein
MSVVVLPSDLDARSPLTALRASAGITLSLKRRDTQTVINDLEERGGYRAKFPQVEATEAVFINTGGGMLGGDAYRFDIRLDAQTEATIASQSAERVYRAVDATPTEVAVSLHLGSEAKLAWLPQETILFDGARLKRNIEVEMKSSAALLMCEAVVFGRAAMGETMRQGLLQDHWRVRRDTKLVFAEALSMTGDMQAQLAEAAVGNGARAAATLLYVAPDAEERCPDVRSTLDAMSNDGGGARAAVSAWNGMLSARFLADDGAALRTAIIHVVTCLTQRPMPRVWNC